MIINDQEVNIDDLISQKHMHKKLDNGLYLSEYQIEVLKRNKIDPSTLSGIDELIYIREKERNYNFFSKQNQRLNQEIKTVKSTKGWINYKKDNLSTRFKSNISKNNGD